MVYIHEKIVSNKIPYNFGPNSIKITVVRVAKVLENPGKSWNWGENFSGPGKFLNLGLGPVKPNNKFCFEIKMYKAFSGFT